MNRKLKIAVLGGGGILAAHAPGLNRISELCEVVAVAEPNEARHGEIRRLLQKDVPVYRDYNEIFNLSEIDSVDILLPHNLHMDAAIKAAEKGLHVLCEKVMARNIYECQAMIDACNKSGVILAISHDRRYAGDWVSLKNIIDSGELGDVLSIKMEHNQDVCFSEDSWGRTFDGLGGGAIMSCLTHQIDALRWYLGEAEKVNCMLKILPERMEGECIGTINAAMKSGALALLSINWHTQSHQWGGAENNGLWYEFIHVTGTRGEAYYMSGRGTFLKKHKIHDVSDNACFIKIETGQSISGHEKCIEEFVKAACGEPAQVLTYGADTIKTVEIAEAAYISAATDKTVTLPIEATPWEQRIY